MKKFIILCLFVSAGKLTSAFEEQLDKILGLCNQLIANVQKAEAGLPVQEIVVSRRADGRRVDESDDQRKEALKQCEKELNKAFFMISRTVYTDYFCWPELLVVIQLLSLNDEEIQDRGEDLSIRTMRFRELEGLLTKENIEKYLALTRDFEAKKKQDVKYNGAIDDFHKHFRNAIKQNPHILTIFGNFIETLEPELQTRFKKDLLPYMADKNCIALINTGIGSGGEFWKNTVEIMINGHEVSVALLNGDYANLSLKDKIASMKQDIPIADKMQGFDHKTNGFWILIEARKNLGPAIDLCIALNHDFTNKPEDVEHLRIMMSPGYIESVRAILESKDENVKLQLKDLQKALKGFKLHSSLSQEARDLLNKVSQVY